MEPHDVIMISDDSGDEDDHDHDPATKRFDAEVRRLKEELRQQAALMEVMCNEIHYFREEAAWLTKESELQRTNARRAVVLSNRGPCPVCLVPLDVTGKALGVISPCGHAYHAECANGWFATKEGKPNCPTCRGDAVAMMEL